MQQNSTKKSFRVSWYLVRPKQALSAVLALFLALAGTGIATAQTVYTTVPPAQAGTSGLNRAPSGSVAFQRAASIYTAAEMANLPQGQPITKLGFNITAPAAAATTGNIKVYLVNSTDGSFLRSTTWATFLSATPAMQLVYDGPLTIPNTAGWYEITLTTPFTYTGNSVYMAFDWQRTGAATGAPTYATNSDPVAGTNGWRGASGAALPTDITGTSAFRPWLQLGYTPPADDAAVLAVWALGRLPLNTAAVPHEIKAAIGNKGSNPIVNRTFTLTVTGANPYTSQITASIPVGDTLIATFTGYTPTNTGSNTITVTTPTDDVATNNSVEMTQLTTANAMAYTQGNPAVATGAVGITATTGAGSGAFLARYTVANSTPVTVPSVRAVIANNTPSIGKRVFAVVLDASGTLLSRSAGYNIQASDLGNSVTFPMATPPTLTNTAFYVGLAVTPDATTAYYPVGTQTDGYVPDNAYYAILSDTTFTGVNAPQEVDFLGRFMLEAILQPVNDIGVAAVTGPASGCGLSSAEQICVVVQNYGSGAQSNIPVSYSINGGTPVTETVAGPIAGGASATYCFTATANFSVPGAYTVEVYSGNASDASAINDTTSSTINSVASPAVSFSGLPASVCSNGTAIALTGTPAGGTFSGPGITGSSFNPATAGAGTHNITYTVIQAGCTATVTNTVVVDTAPTVSFTGLAASYCSDEAPVTLLPTPATGTFSGPGISGNDFDPSTAGAGTHTITYTYTTGACTVTSTQTVIVTAPATVTFTGLANNYCVTSAAVTLTGAPAGGTFSGPGITGNTFNPATAGAGTHIITYTNSAGSCSGSSDQTVVVDPAPMATISGLAASYCVGEPVVTLTGTPAGGTFSGTGITGNDFDPATAGVGTHIITYTATQGLCTATTTDTVTINALPVVDAGADHSVCSDETAYMLTGFSPAGGTWSGTGVSANGEFNAVTAGNGQHILTYTVGQGGCTASDEVAVTVYAMPVATFTHTNTGPAYTFTPSSPALGVSYSWDFGDNNTSTDQNPTHTYTANGTYTVTLTIVHAMCTATTSQTLSVLVGMEDDLAAMLSLYPNPTNGKLTLEGIQLTSAAKVEVTNMLGQTLLINQWQPNQEKLLLDIAGLPSGSYLIRISDDKTSVVKQVVLQR